MPVREKRYSIFLFIGILLLYRLSLDYIYTYIISPVFEYSHFVLSFSAPFYALVFAWFIIITIYDYKLFIDNRPSSNLLFFIDVFYFIPFTSMASLAGFNPSFVLFGFIFWVLMSGIQLAEVSKKRNDAKVNGVLAPSSLFFTIAWIIVIINTIITIYYNGFHIKFDLSDVYDLRSAMRDLQMPGLVGYIKPWASKVTIILLLLYLERKHWAYVGVLSVIQLMNFAFGGLKGDLFTLLVAFVVGLFYINSRKRFILYALLLLNGVVLLEYSLTGISTVSILIHRRMLFMPCLLSSEYFTFFSSHELVVFRDSFLRWFGVENPYHIGIPYLIGAEFYDAPEMGANTGIIGDDFAQLGWLSLLIFPLLRVKALNWGIDKARAFMSDKLCILICFMFAFSFISGSFFSILLTGGYIIITLLLLSMKKGKKTQDEA